MNPNTTVAVPNSPATADTSSVGSSVQTPEPARSASTVGLIDRPNNPDSDPAAGSEAGDETSEVIKPTPSRTEDQIALLREEIARLERQQQAELEAAEREKMQKLDAKLEEIRQLLGAKTVGEVAVYLKNRTASSPKGRRVPETVREQIRLALEHGATGPEVAKDYGVSEAWVWTYKRKLGLTHKGIGGRNRKPAAPAKGVKGGSGGGRAKASVAA